MMESSTNDGGSLPMGRTVAALMRQQKALAYARVTIPLGKQPKRIDCSRMYEWEIERLQEEIALLRMNAR